MVLKWVVQAFTPMLKVIYTDQLEDDVLNDCCKTCVVVEILNTHHVCAQYIDIADTLAITFQKKI